MSNTTAHSLYAASKEISATYDPKIIRDAKGFADMIETVFPEDYREEIRELREQIYQAKDRITEFADSVINSAFDPPIKEPGIGTDVQSGDEDPCDLSQFNSKP